MRSSSSDQAGLLRVEERDAWFDYLSATLGQRDGYTEVESWAWARLQQRLRALKRKRGRVAA